MLADWAMCSALLCLPKVPSERSATGGHTVFTLYVCPSVRTYIQMQIFRKVFEIEAWCQLAYPLIGNLLNFSLVTSEIVSLECVQQASISILGFATHF